MTNIDHNARVGSSNEPQSVFEKIYATNAWKGDESLSGPSSSMARTSTIREALPGLIEKYSIKTFLDAPCGDFHWMKSAVNQIRATYIGGDIVKSLIESNKLKYERDGVQFVHLDITKDSLPKADIMFCRDCLFHLSYRDIASFLDNFLRSKIPLLMTTSHTANMHLENRDIKTGDWRWFYLMKPPFDFPEAYQEAIIDGGGDRMMYIWTKSELQPAAERFIRFHGTGA